MENQGGVLSILLGAGIESKVHDRYGTWNRFYYKKTLFLCDQTDIFLDLKHLKLILHLSFSLPLYKKKEKNIYQEKRKKGRKKT